MKTRAVLRLLRAFESRNVTFVAPDGGWPIVWDRARGCHVQDVDGRRYLDLTAAFGVAAAGHANPAVVRAGQRQLARLGHAMGDVHPHVLKALLARELSRVTFGRWRPAGRASTGKAIFCNSGFEAVEAALKTARLATGRSGIVAFEGAYHGVGYGTLNATHRGHFRDPFRDQLREFARFVPFPKSNGCGCSSPDAGCGVIQDVERRVRALLRRGTTGAVLVEPIQGRGGIRIPAPELLPMLRRLCDEHGVLLILDEIFTGFGRTGRWFACERPGVVPDLICLGKALAGGFPLSACVGRADLMDAAWPAGTGEAIHTSTFLGNPVGCAMALAQIGELRRLRLSARAERLGRVLSLELEAAASAPGRLRAFARCQGLMGGIELRHRDDTPAGAEALGVVRRLLARGFILLPEGEHGEVISLTPPLTIPEAALLRATRALREELERL